MKYPWLIAFIRFTQRILLPANKFYQPGKKKVINVSWLDSRFIALKFGEPCGRNLKDLLALGEPYITLITQTRLDDHRLNDAEKYNRWAEQCLRKHLFRLIDFKIELVIDENSKLIPFLDAALQIKYLKDPIVRETPNLDDRIADVEEEEQFVAAYLLENNSPTVAHVRILWGKDDMGKWPISATLRQASRLELYADTIFESVGEVTEVKLPNKEDYILYIRFEKVFGSGQEQKRIIFQCVIEFFAEDGDIDGSGTFCSLQSINRMVPSSGLVALIAGTESHFSEIKSKLQKGKYRGLNDSTDLTVAKFNLAMKAVGNELLISSPIKKEGELKKHVGTYVGSFSIPENDDFLKHFEFAMEIFHSGRFRLKVSLRDMNSYRELLGYIDITESNILFFKHSIRNDFFNFTVAYNESSELQEGIYVGSLFKNRFLSYHTGTISYERTEGTLDETFALLRSREYSINDDSLRPLLIAHESKIHNDESQYPDFQLIRKLISPVSVSRHTDLLLLNLPLEFTYLTFRIPHQHEWINGDINTAYRIEKCSLKFLNNFRDVEIRSISNEYRGKVYYNGQVILMILSPKLDMSGAKKDSYLTIQIDTSANRVYGQNPLQSFLPDYPADSTKTVLFGTSTWKGEKFLEAKMIVLIEPDQIENDGVITTDNEPEVISIGRFGERFDGTLERLRNEDKKYCGALTYLCGRLNRHIHVSSGGRKRSILRPRDVASREPYMLAALYLAEKLPTDSLVRKKDINKIKEFLFESYLHQYGTSHYAGVEFNDLFIDSLQDDLEPAVRDRFETLLAERDLLKTSFKEIKNLDIKQFMVRLWPYLEIERPVSTLN